MHAKIRPALIISSIIFITFASCSTQATAQTQNQYNITPAFPNLTFNNPTGIIPDPTNSNRIFVTEQTGTVKVFNNTHNTPTANTFLDITNQVLYGGEQGLLGLAFHPNYTQNGYLYLNYVADNPKRTVIARYTVNTENPNQADPKSQQVILEIPQPPYSNHKGGQLAFGPDGCLYIGVGDGGSAGDPQGNAQNSQTLLGKILRIDVDSASGDRNYGIPSGNPYAENSEGRAEIYALGFRNPWRFSFDTQTGQLWVADVGQNQLEEIDIVEAGGNYGWNIMEGTFCYNPPSGCDQNGLTLPVYNYTRDQGTAIIGGYVIHNQTNPEIDGSYVYGDYGSGRIWALRIESQNLNNTLLLDSGFDISSFGLDHNGQLYIAAYDGKIYTLTVNVIPEYPSTRQTLAGLVAVAALTAIVAVAIKRERTR
jgi:glucose/arabinose dehydrogenase